MISLIARLHCFRNRGKYACFRPRSFVQQCSHSHPGAAPMIQNERQRRLRFPTPENLDSLDLRGCIKQVFIVCVYHVVQGKAALEYLRLCCACRYEHEMLGTVLA